MCEVGGCFIDHVSAAAASGVAAARVWERAAPHQVRGWLWITLGFVPLSTLLLHSLSPLCSSGPVKEYSCCCSGAVYQQPLHHYTFTCPPIHNPTRTGWVSLVRACSCCWMAAVTSSAALRSARQWLTMTLQTDWTMTMTPMPSALR